MDNTSFLYFIVPGKSIACQLETLLINRLPAKGFKLAGVAYEAAMMGGNAIQFHPLYMKRRIFPFHVYGK